MAIAVGLLSIAHVPSQESIREWWLLAGSGWIWLVMLGLNGMAGWLIRMVGVAVSKCLMEAKKAGLMERISWHLGVLLGLAAFYLHLHLLLGK